MTQAVLPLRRPGVSGIAFPAAARRPAPPALISCRQNGILITLKHVTFLSTRHG